MKTEQEIKDLAKEMTNSILKSLKEENNPLELLIEMYIEAKLKTFKESLKDN